MSLYLGNNLISGSGTSMEPLRNMGQIISSTLPLMDAGLHLLDGTLISGSGSYGAFVDYIADIYDSGNYPDLFDTEANWQSAVTAYGVCGKFVYDSVNNTVRLPKITGIIEGTTNVSALGDLVEAGLPNITGSITNAYFYKTYVADGALSFAEGWNTASNSGSDSRYGQLSLDASRSSSIYGNSVTVQPQTIKVLYYIVIATTTKTDVEVDIDEIATDLNGKADVDGSNMANSVKNFDGGWVDSRLIMASNISTPTTSNTIYDLSSYLPNDGYDYEVLLSLQVTSGTTSGNAATIYFQTDVINAGHIYGARAVTRTNSSNSTFSFGAVPVGTGRTITVMANSSNTGTYYLILNAYRRLGTNQ